MRPWAIKVVDGRLRQEEVRELVNRRPAYPSADGVEQVGPRGVCRRIANRAAGQPREADGALTAEPRDGA